MGIHSVNPVKTESSVKVERGLPNTTAVKKENKPQPKPVKKAIAKTTTPKTDTATAQKKDAADKNKLKISDKKMTDEEMKEFIKKIQKILEEKGYSEKDYGV